MIGKVTSLDLSFTTFLCDRNPYYLYFAAEETEDQRGCVTCLRSHSNFKAQGKELGWEPGDGMLSRSWPLTSVQTLDKCPEVVQPPGTEASPPHHIGHMDSLCPTYAMSLIPVRMMLTFPRSIYHNTLWGKKRKTPRCVTKFSGLNLKNWSGLIEAGFFNIY